MFAKKLYSVFYVFAYVIFYCVISVLLTAIVFFSIDISFDTLLLDPELPQAIFFSVVAVLICCVFIIFKPPKLITNENIHKGPIGSYAKTIKGRLFIVHDRVYIEKDDQTYLLKDLLEDADNRIVSLRVHVSEHIGE